MPDIGLFEFRDLFQWFRFMLGLVVTIYFTIITAQSLWGWYVWLSGSDKYMSLLRRYLIVHSLRLRFQAFWGDVIICVLLGIAFFMIWHAQGILDHVEEAVRSSHVQRVTQHS